MLTPVRPSSSTRPDEEVTARPYACRHSNVRHATSPHNRKIRPIVAPNQRYCHRRAKLINAESSPKPTATQSVQFQRAAKAAHF